MLQRGRKKIGSMLWAMGFHDDNPTANLTTMRQKIRQIAERNNADDNKHSTITFKFRGRTTSVVNVPLHHHSTALSDQQMVDPSMEDDDVTTEDYYNSDDRTSYENKGLRMEEKKNNLINYNSDNHMKIHLTNDDEDEVLSVLVEMIESKRSRTHQLPSVSNPTMNEQNPNPGININGNENKTVMGKIDEFIRSIGGTGVELVTEKKLTASDVKKSQGRLLIPMSQVRNPGFLTEKEKEVLVMKDFMSVVVFDPERRQWRLNLAQWRMKNENLVLRTNWIKLVQESGLKKDTVIRVWSFRVDQQLCFAIVRV